MSDPIFVTSPLLPKKKDFLQYVDRIWDTGWLTNEGPLHKEFESELKDFLSIKNLVLTVNGHSALDIAIKGLSLTGEVITTPFTFASTPHSIALNGLVPVFCDIKESDLTIDEEKIEGLITEKTSAIMPVHVYGHLCNSKRIEEIAKKYHLKIIYDAAHTFGITEDGKSAAMQGDVSILSFHATKLFNSIEGGALVFNNKKLEQVFKDYKNFGIHGEEHIEFIGGNAKMNEFQAAMGLCNLKSVKLAIARRGEITRLYRKYLQNIKGIRLFYPDSKPRVCYNYSYFPIIVEKEHFGISRDMLYELLAKENIYTRKYFYPIATECPCYENEGARADVPTASRQSRKVLTLPIYYGLSDEDVIRICNLIVTAVR